MARTFGVRPSFFVGDHDENQADPIQEEAEMRAMIGDASITAGAVARGRARLAYLRVIHPRAANSLAACGRGKACP